MSTLYSRYFSALGDYQNGDPIDDRDIDGDLDGITTAINRKVLCSGSAPTSPIAGQTWVDTTNKLLKIYRNNEWVSISSIHVHTSAMTTPQEGDLWYDTTNNLLKAYTGSAWSIHAIVPATNTDAYIPQWDGANSATLKDGVELSTDGTLGDNSDSAIPTEKAVKTYVDTLSNYEIFTSSGTFNVPANVSKVFVSGCGAGGGGGGGETGHGGGGGAGGLSVSNVPYTVTPSGTVSVTINAAGTAGVSGGANGGNGGTAVFGTLTLYGGGGGATTSGASGAGGNTSAERYQGMEKAGEAGSSGNYGGQGGGSFYGIGGAQSAGAGNAGTGYGAGGGGGYGANNGAAGTAGVIIVRW